MFSRWSAAFSTRIGKVTEEVSLAPCLKHRVIESCRLNGCKAVHVLSLTLHGGDGITGFLFLPLGSISLIPAG
jgi:hypothetical protein